LYSFTFEIDSNFLVDAINSRSSGVLEFSDVVSNVRNMLKKLSMFN
jgi:hypothetical protein